MSPNQIIDLRALLTSMAQALQSPGPLDWLQIAPTLGLDLGNARLTGAVKAAWR